jgi:pilus assembly protein CpaE
MDNGTFTSRPPLPGLEALTLTIVGGSSGQRQAIRGLIMSITDIDMKLLDDGNGDRTRSGAAPSIVLIVLSDDYKSWPDEIRELTRETPDASRLALVGRRSAEAVRVALRAGADDVLFLPLDRDEVSRWLVRRTELGGGTAPPKKAFTCSLASVAGGVGVSSIAITVAFALKRITGRQVALLDLGLQCSALSQLLDIEPDHTIIELVDPTTVVDSIRLESIFCKHQSGLYLLAAPKRIEEAEMVSAATVSAALSTIREMFDFIIVDSGHHVNEASVAAWQHSDSFFYLLNQSVTSVRAALRFARLLEALHLEVTPSMVLNRYRAEHPVSRQKIEAAIHQPVAFTIPEDEKAFSELQFEGDDPGARTKSPARRSIENLAREIAGIPSPERDSTRSVFSQMRLALDRFVGGANGTH